MSSLGLLEAKLTPISMTSGNYCDGWEFCGANSDTWVGGVCVCVDCGDVSTSGGFQRIYADLTP